MESQTDTADSRRRLDKITETIIGCVFKVSHGLGGGFLEKEYEKAGVKAEQQHSIKVVYDNRIVADFCG